MTRTGRCVATSLYPCSLRNGANVLLRMLLLLGLSATVAWSQATTSVRGTVTDSSGSAVVGAAVKITSAESKVERSTTTGADGVYQFLFLPPGKYVLSVTATGFQRYEIAGVELLVNTPATVNAQLKVGAAVETVTVTSEQPALNLVDASIGNSFDELQVRQVPLEGRNVPDLLSLQAGVSYTGNRTDIDRDQDTRNGSVNGARSDQSNITLDGVDVNDQSSGYAFTSVLPVTLDSVQEFRVTTTNYGADQGQGSGAQVALVTKSGTNSFHGSAYEYLRNTATSANDYLVKNAELLDGAPNKPPKLNRNIFGASLGGPIRKDRLFFFANYEGTRQREEHSAVRSIPTPALRDGVVRYLCTLNPDGSPNTTACPGNPVQGISGTSYPVSPGYWGLSATDLTHIDPLLQGPNPVMLNYFNQTFGNFATNDFSVGDGLNYAGYRFRAPVKLDNNAFIVKLDYHLDAAGKHTLSWRGALQNIYNPQEPFLPGSPPEQVVTDHSKGFALGYTAVLSSTKVNSFRWGFTRQSNGAVGNTFHDMNFFLGLDQGQTYSHNFQIPLHNLTDDFSWTKGKHSIQFGGNIGIARDARLTYGHSFNYGLGTSNWMSPTGIADTASPLDPSNSSAHPAYVFPEVDLSFKGGYDRPVIGLFGMISDVVSQYNYNKNGTVENYVVDGQGNPISPTGAPMKRNYGLNWYEFYAQDSWRVKPNLTLTYGLRWSIFPAPWETNGFQVASAFGLGTQFNINSRSMLQGNGYTSEPPITLIPGGPANHGPGFYNTSKSDFSPRFAFAYSPHASGGFWKTIFGDGEKTSIRGGISSVYDRAGFQLINTFDTNAPGGFSYTLQNPCCTAGATDVSNEPRITDLQVVPNKTIQLASGPYTFLQPALPGAFPQQLPLTQTNLWGLDNTLKTPRSVAIDFSIARELPKHFSVQFAYVGHLGRHLLTRRDLNQPLDIVDTKTGIDYFAAATRLSQLARQGYTLSQINDTLVGPTAAYWHDMLPGLTGGATSYVSGCGGTITNPGAAGLVQAVFDLYYNPACAYVGNEIVGLADIDIYGLLGDNGSHTPGVNPLWFNGPPGLNQAPGFQGQGKFLNSQAISAYAWSSIGNSNYHALQATLRKQLSSGTQFDLNYTFSKSIDITSTAARTSFALVGYQNIGIVGSQLENAFNPNSQRAVSDFDTTHQLNANWLIELPFGRGRHFAGNVGSVTDNFIGGWELTGVTRWTSGYPFTVDVGQNWPTDWFYTGITQMIAKPKAGAYKQPNGSVSVFPDPKTAQSDYIIPFPGGQLSRNTVRGQGYAGLDMGVSKRWRTFENQSLQFKWDVFNVLNLTRFNAQGLGTAVTSLNQTPALFGTYSSLLTQPRVMQFALRYEF